MKIKTRELMDQALDWAAAKAEYTDRRVEVHEMGGVRVECGPGSGDLYGIGWFNFRGSTDHAQGGPILEREGISTIRLNDDYGTDANGFTTGERLPVWGATSGQHGVETTTQHQQHDPMFQIYEEDVIYGPSQLVAGLRCFVVSRLGKEVEVPDELLQPRQQVGSPADSEDVSASSREQPRAG